MEPLSFIGRWVIYHWANREAFGNSRYGENKQELGYILEVELIDLQMKKSSYT